MNIRKFVAATSREALRQVRREIGDDAVILANRNVEEGIEITALPYADYSVLAQRDEVSRPVLSDKGKAAQTVDNRAPDKISAPVMQEGIIDEIRSMRSMLQEQLSCLSWVDMQQRDPLRSQLMRRLLNSGWSPLLTRQLLSRMPVDAGLPWVTQVLAHNLQRITAKEGIIERGGVVALTGPTGVGKTTTIAKLAARAVVRHGAEKVALITTDSYRIGAHEQLRIYGKILGVAVHPVRDIDDLRLTLSGLKHKHLVLIDTIGMGQRDDRVTQQTEMFNAAGVQRILLLNATSSGDTLDEVVRMYNGAGALGCIPTKLDEALALGTVLDVALRNRLMLHYVADGQRVPEDLQEINVDVLLQRAFRETEKPAPFDMDELDCPAFMAELGAAPGIRRECAA